MNLERLKKLMIISALALLIVTGGLVWGISHSYKNWQSAQEKIEVAEEDIVVMEKRLQRLNLLRERGQELETELQRRRGILPDNLNEEILMKAIHQAVLTSNGRVLEMRFDDVISKGKYKEFPFRLTFEGTYLGLMELLAGLGKGPEIYRIEDLTIQGFEDRAPLQANLKIVAFFSDGS